MWLTLNDTAKYLQLSKETLYKFAQNNEIPCKKIGNQWRFNKIDIDSWMFTANPPHENGNGTNDSKTKKEKKDLGSVHLEFLPRKSLNTFVNDRENVSVLEWTSGKKGSLNMAIWGENLSSLAAMKAGSVTSGKEILVDIIYIDPPYNVGGKQGYKNTWKGKSEKERDWAKDHGAFLDFMEPRLKIGQSLLSKSGIIFISICDEEYATLKVLMNQMFGEENELATFIWNKGRAAAGSHAAASHEFILCYAKDKKCAPNLQQEKPGAQRMIDKAKEFLSAYPFAEAEEKFKKWVTAEKKAETLKPGESAYSSIHPDNKRLFHADNSCAHDDPGQKRCRKVLLHPITKKPCPVPKNGWKWSEKTLNRLVEENRLWFGKDHSVVPKIIKYLDEHMYQLPLTVIYDGADGKNDLPPDITFTTPKPVSLIKLLLSFYPNKNAVVLDYFAGSGTTAAATKRLNDEDGGNRTWIMVEEMGSTFNKVLLPRIKYFSNKNDFSIFSLTTATVSNKQLLGIFQNYSFNFFSAYHNLDEKKTTMTEGMYIIGFEEKHERIIAMTIPAARKNKNFFEMELGVLKDKIKQTKAKSILIYGIDSVEGVEEPWRDNDKSILSNTSCKNFNVVNIPEKLIKEWNEVLTAMAH